MEDKQFVFSQMHIDAARNATDDFNLFHDKKRWQEIHQNPFSGPIVLGFQLEGLIEYQLKRYRQEQAEECLIKAHGLRFSNYQFTFADVVKPGQLVNVEIKKTRFQQEPECSLNNRVIIKTDKGLALVGYKRETKKPLYLPDADFTQLSDISLAKDRSFLPDGDYFLKQKFMANSNAKNFLSGSWAEQSDYFDELQDKIQFPEIFPCSLISCALLEKAKKTKHDFINTPMVYTSHKITVDRDHLARMRSRDKLSILILKRQRSNHGKAKQCELFECYGLLDNETILFRALIELMPLSEIISSLGCR